MEYVTRKNHSSRENEEGTGKEEVHVGGGSSGGKRTWVWATLDMSTEGLIDSLTFYHRQNWLFGGLTQIGRIWDVTDFYTLTCGVKGFCAISAILYILYCSPLSTHCAFPPLNEDGNFARRPTNDIQCATMAMNRMLRCKWCKNAQGRTLSFWFPRSSLIAGIIGRIAHAFAQYLTGLAQIDWQKTLIDFPIQTHLATAA